MFELLDEPYLLLQSLLVYHTIFYFIFFLLYYIGVPKWYVNSIIFKINVIYILNKDSHKIDGSYYEYYTFTLSLNHVGEIVTIPLEL